MCDAGGLSAPEGKTVPGATSKLLRIAVSLAYTKVEVWHAKKETVFRFAGDSEL